MDSEPKLSNEEVSEITPVVDTSSSLFDGVDPSLSEHIACFLGAVSNTLHISRLSISSAKDAGQALSLLNELQDKVRNHRKTAEALKKALIASGEWSTEGDHEPTVQ